MPPQTPTPPAPLPPVQTPSPGVSPVQPSSDPNYNLPPAGGSKLKLTSLFADKSFGKTIGLLAGAAIGIIIIIVIISSVFFKGPDYAGALAPVAQQQYNLAIITQQLGTQYAQNQLVKNLSQDISGTMFSDLNTMQSYLKNATGKTLSSKVIQSTLSSTTTTQLQSANNSNNFDQVFLQVINSSFKTYNTALGQALTKIKGVHGRQMLFNDGKQLSELNKEAQNAAVSLNNN